MASVKASPHRDKFLFTGDHLWWDEVTGLIWAAIPLVLVEPRSIPWNGPRPGFGMGAA
jgi:hypothetical protein